MITELSHWIIRLGLITMGLACLYVGVRIIMFTIRGYAALYRRWKEIKSQRH
jgi:hypothetical protein